MTEHLPNPEEGSSTKTFLEIGYGPSPAYVRLNSQGGPREYFADVNYIGVDLNVEDYEVDAAKHVTGAIDTSHMSAIGLNEGTIEDLSLPPEAIDEAYMANVFSECWVVERARGKPVFDKLVGQLEKLYQVLKPGALLTVVETNTPIKEHIVANALNKNGLIVDKVIRESEDPLEWARYKQRFYISDGGDDEVEPYILIAHKKDLEAEESVDHTN